MNNESFQDTKNEQKIKPAEKKFFILEGSKKNINRFLGIFWLVSTAFLFLRIFLESIGSDPRSIFVTIIYIISGVFLLPFFGILPGFNNTIQPGKPTFDAPALTAIFSYTILILLAVALTHLFTKIMKTEKQVDETVEKNNPVSPTKAENEIQ